MKKSIIKSTALIMVFTLLSKVLGFVKSMIQASYFGANEVTDAFNIANGFSTNILYLIATAISVSFVPVYTKYRLDDKQDEKRMASRTVTFLYLAGECIAIVIFIFATPLMKVAAPSYNGEQLANTVLFFRVLLLGFCFSIGTNIFQQLLNSEKAYGYSAVSSLVNSVVVIICIVMLHRYIGIWSLIVAIIISMMAQNIVVAYRGRKYAKFTFRYGIWDDSIKLLLIQSAPIFFSQGTIEINEIVDKALLASAEAGAVTAVAYAGVLNGFVTQLLSISFSTVLFTEISELAVGNEVKEIRKLLNETLKIIVVISIPIMIFVFLQANEIVTIVYGRGSFGQEAISMTAKALAIYILCLMPLVLKAIIVKAYYSFNDTKNPMKISIAGVIVNIGVSVALSHKLGMIGVVIGTIIAEWICYISMYLHFNYKHIRITDNKTWSKNWKMIVACILMYLFVEGSNAMTAMLNIYLRFVIRGILSFGMYFFVLLFLRDESVVKIVGILFSQIKKYLRR